MPLTRPYAFPDGDKEDSGLTLAQLRNLTEEQYAALPARQKWRAVQDAMYLIDCLNDLDERLEALEGGTPTPTLTVTPGSLTFTTAANTPSTAQAITVSGAHLTAPINFPVPTGYQAALAADGSQGWGTSIALTPVNGSVSPTQVYTRLASNAPGSYPGTFTVTSTGATALQVGVTGTVAGAQVPAQVGTVTPTPGAGSMSLAFGAVTGATSYRARYRAAGTGSYILGPTATASPIVITGLTADSRDFTVAAINSAGEGTPSVPVTATPQAPANSQVPYTVPFTVSS